MSTHRHIDAICVAVLVLTLLLTLLFMNGKAFGIEPIIDEDAEGAENSVWFTGNDKKGDWDASRATRITLHGDHASVAGGGAFAYDRNVIISNAGHYVLSGTLDDGRVVVDTDSKAKVWILLEGVTVTCSDGPCLDVEQADKVFLSLAEGTENTLRTLAFSSDAQTLGQDGALFSRDDLTINGSGSLTVTTPDGHGIVSNDELVITGGTLTVSAFGDALHANDSLRVMDAVMTLDAGDDGISVTGLESDFYMESGSITVTAGDKGLAAGNSLLLCGGSLTVDAREDGISADGSVTVEGGEITVTAGDDGIHAETAFALSGGVIHIPACYEGIEAVTIDISGGELTVYPEDDGLNANGGVPSFGGMGGMHGGHGNGGGFGGNHSGTLPPPPMPSAELPGGLRPGENAEPDAGPEAGSPPDAAAGADETWIHVRGGSVTVVNDTARDADGLDSNGDIIISGGVIRVSLTNSGNNSALDFGSESGGVMEISGGEVIACGSYSMAEGFSDGSTQCAVLYNIKRGAPAGTEIRLEDASGTVLLRYEVPCSFSSAALSCPEMRLGETYTVFIGDTSEEITLETVSASFGDAQSEGFGGPMNWGGQRFRPDNGFDTETESTQEP